MGEDGTQTGAAAAAFDGKIKEWPEEGSINVSNVPTEKNKFILYMACELFKAQNITSPKEQAKKSIEYANALYSELHSKKFI